MGISQTVPIFTAPGMDYSYLRNYNTELGRISKSLNQIAKRINNTNHIYQEDMHEVKELMNQVSI